MHSMGSYVGGDARLRQIADGKPDGLMEPRSREVDSSSPATPAASQPATVCTATNLPPAASLCVNNTVCVCVRVFLAAIYDVVEEKADSEPDFQYIPEKSPQDPTQLDQHALRDSMVVLKDGLASGAVLAQFDVSRHICRVAERLAVSCDDPTSSEGGGQTHLC